jgi:hypothetical protein
MKDDQITDTIRCKRRRTGYCPGSLKRLEIGLHRTERQIERFEKEYNVSSDVFQRDFAAEDMKKGDQEFIEWAGEIKVKERILRDLNNLKGIQYVAQ